MMMMMLDVVVVDHDGSVAAVMVTAHLCWPPLGVAKVALVVVFVLTWLVCGRISGNVMALFKDS